MSHPLFQSLLAKASTSPSATCLGLYGASGLEKNISYSDFVDGIAAAAGHFQCLDVVEGDIVLIFGQHSEGIFLSFFGAQWLGAIPAFMPPPTIKQNIDLWSSSHRQLVDRIKPKIIVSEAECIEHVRSLGVDNLLSVSEIERADRATAKTTPVSVSLDQIAFLQHSSGTTGLKKGVTVTYRQLLSQLDTYASVIGFGPDSSVVSWLPVYHDMGLIAATLLPFRNAVPIRLIDTFGWLSNPSQLISLLSEFDNSFCWLPNFAFNYLAKRTRFEFGSISLAEVAAIINCSEPCKDNDMSAFKSRFSPHGLPEHAVQVCYAAAEYVFAMTQTSRTEPLSALLVDADMLEVSGLASLATDQTRRAKPVVPVGRPVPGAEIRIANDRPEGHVGEVIIRGPSLCSGYFRNEETTQQKFAEGWYRTGDLGFFHQDVLYITGRTDDLINVRGKNIYAHDVEELVSSLLGVKPGRTTAFGVDDANNGTQNLVLAVEPTGELATRELKNAINDRISASFGIVPADVVAVQSDTLVKTTSGKISRSENRNRYIAKTLQTVS